MFNLRTGAAALVILSCAVSACRKPAAATQDQANTAAAQKQAEPAKPVPEVLPTVVARVNGEEVVKADLERLLKLREMEAGEPVPKERRDEIYRALIDQLVTYTALVQEARARGITVTDAEAKQAFDEQRAMMPDEGAFNKALADRNMTAEGLRADLRNGLAVNKMMEAELAKPPAVSDAEVQDFYDKNPDEFTEVRASHILFKTDGADDAAKKKSRAAAEDVLKQAKAGADFAELARKHSGDGSAQQGGDLGFFNKGRMVPEFSNAAFNLKPGQTSDIVETQFGYHIIKVTDRKVVPMAEVSEKIRAFLARRKSLEMQKAFVSDVKNKSKIEVLF